MGYVCNNAVQSTRKLACDHHSELDQKMEVFRGQKFIIVLLRMF